MITSVIACGVLSTFILIVVLNLKGIIKEGWHTIFYACFLVFFASLWLALYLGTGNPRWMYFPKLEFVDWPSTDVLWMGQVEGKATYVLIMEPDSGSPKLVALPWSKSGGKEKYMSRLMNDDGTFRLTLDSQGELGAEKYPAMIPDQKEDTPPLSVTP